MSDDYDMIDEEEVSTKTSKSGKKQPTKKDKTTKGKTTKKTDQQVQTDQKTEGKDKKPKVTYKKITVDFWATDWHGEEIGIRQAEQHRAKSRQFSKDMEIYGAILENGNKIGFVGWRKEAWESGIDEEPEEIQGEVLGPSKAQIGRLIIKSFTNESNWTGTIEEQVAIELARSHKEALPVFLLMMPKNEYLIRLERVFTYYGNLYTTSIITQEKDNKAKIMDIFEIDEKLLTLGSDWVVRRKGAKKDDIVAKIDGKIFNVGGKSVISIYDEQLAKSKPFVMLVLLFAAMTKFHKKVKDKIKQVKKQIAEGKIIISPTHQELELMRNPRLLRR